MIRYSLVCERKHEFEIWFKNSADYDKQSRRGLVNCPSCGSAKVEKALMAPSLRRGTRKGTKRSSDIAGPAAIPAPDHPAPAQTQAARAARAGPRPGRAARAQGHVGGPRRNSGARYPAPRRDQGAGGDDIAAGA